MMLSPDQQAVSAPTQKRKPRYESILQEDEEGASNRNRSTFSPSSSSAEGSGHPETTTSYVERPEIDLNVEYEPSHPSPK